MLNRPALLEDIYAQAMCRKPLTTEEQADLASGTIFEMECPLPDIWPLMNSYGAAYHRFYDATIQAIYAATDALSPQERAMMRSRLAGTLCIHIALSVAGETFDEGAIEARIGIPLALLVQRVLQIQGCGDLLIIATTGMARNEWRVVISEATA